MLVTEGYIFLPSFNILWGVVLSAVPAFSLIFTYLSTEIFFFSMHILSAVWQRQDCGIDLGRGSCDNTVSG